MQVQSHISNGHQRGSRTRRNVGNVALIRFVLRTKSFFHNPEVTFKYFVVSTYKLKRKEKGYLIV